MSGADAFFQEPPREMFRALWERARRGESFGGDEALLVKAMLAHPEWEEAWARPAEDRTPHGRPNPYLHALLHCAVERQLQDGLPPEVREAYERLLKGGLSDLDSVHRIGDAFAAFFEEMYRTGRPFDPAAYARALQRIA